MRATTPDPEVPAKVQRRQFTAAYRLGILKEADACTKHGALGALLRREGLYSSHLVNWRRQRDQGELIAGRARKRGPTPKPIDPRVKQLESENRRLQRKLSRAKTIIPLQKNCRQFVFGRSVAAGSTASPVFREQGHVPIGSAKIHREEIPRQQILDRGPILRVVRASGR